MKPAGSASGRVARQTLVFLTANGVGNAWIPAQVLGLQQSGLSVELHALRLPSSWHFRSGDITDLARATHAVYPLAPGDFLRNITLAVRLWAPELARIVTRGLLPGRDPWPQRVRALLHLPIAMHLAVRLRDRAGHVHADMAHSPATIALYTARLLGVGFTFMGHANDLFQRRIALADKIRHARAVLCISSFHRDLYRELAACDTRMEIVHLGVETSRFPLVDERPEAEPCHILSSGRLVAKKGFPVLIEACALLAARGHAFHCTIAGSGPLEAELRSLTRDRALGERLTITGQPLAQEDLPEFMASGHLYCLPCVRAPDGDIDGLPVMLMEAMACGLPAVSTRLVGIPDLIEDGHTGLLVEPGDAEGLANALEQLMLDRTRARKLGERGRACVRERFDITRMHEQLHAVFAELLREAVAP